MSDSNPPPHPVAQGPHELERGTIVGRYVLLGTLGQGGMGIVYRAYDPELDRPIALKLLRADDDDGLGGSRQERLLREAQALARLQHPNVIAVYDVGTYRGDVFVAMELVEGTSLRAWLKEARRRRNEVLEAFLAAGEGLAAAHRAGLVHRDFKPDNVMLGDDGRVRVLDFGLARVAQGGPPDVPSVPSSRPPPLSSRPPPLSSRPPPLSSRPPQNADDPTVTGTPLRPSALVTLPAPSDVVLTPMPPSSSNSGSASARVSSSLLDAPLTHADAIVGTPRFMSPEQAIGISIDPRADQFSFSVALYQALYDDYPFPGTPYDDVRDWRVKDPPEGSTVPRWLRQVVVRGLSARASSRFASMDDLLAALRADPSARRARIGRVGAVGAVLLLGAVAGTLSYRSHARVCQGAERELAGVWDDARRATVSRAFQKTGLPYADAALATVERTIDAYARAWSAMHVDACEATHIRGEQSQELLDLRMACLADRRTELRALVDLFSTADATVVEHAAQSAGSLPGFEACADTPALMAPVPPPRDPATRERVEDIRERLSRASALNLAAKYDDGLAIAKGALGDAEAVNYAPIEAEAELDMGRLLGGRGDYAESARAFQSAFVRSLAGRSDETAARAAIDLIIAFGTHQAHYEDGDRWADIAEAIAGRLQRKDELLGALYSSRSSLREREGKYDLALSDAERAIDLQTRVFGPDNFNLAVTYCHLGAVRYARAEYAQALDAYGRCLDIQSRIVGPDHPGLLAARVGMADVYGDSGDHERARAEYESALAAIRKVRPDDPDIPMVQNNLGGELQQLGRPAEAFEEYKAAYDDWRKRVGSGAEAVTAISNMAEAKLALGQPDVALAEYQEGLAICEPALGAGHPVCARILWGIGESYRRMGKLSEALDAFQRSLALFEKALGPTHRTLTVALLGIGQVENARREPAKAKVALARVLAILGDEPGEGLTRPDATFALAQATWDTGDKARAAGLATKAREEYEAAGAPARDALALLAQWTATHG